MSDRLFGTDGVRGVANTELSPTLALSLGLAAAYLLGRGHPSPTFVVGRDSRLSSPMLEAALCAGLCAMGGNVISPGLMPTPAVARITHETGADAGVVISASHNPFPDNGIKFFGPDGYKLADELEVELEALVAKADTLPRPSGAGIGHIRRDPLMRDLYARHIEDTTQGTRLDGLSIVLDAANGAAAELAPRIFSDLGANVIPMNCSPTGCNINEGCGALHPQGMQEAVVREKADLGIAFDGDADRVILSDENGGIVDGDRVMAICGISLNEREKLVGKAVVGTIMSNMGLEVALRERGIQLIRTSVGDRYVSSEMRRGGYVLGGEKSGHIIFGALTTTGDGILSALQLLRVLRESGQSLSQLASVMKEYPQLLVNVRVSDRRAWESDAAFQARIAEVSRKLDGQGRINVRASGTEKLLRVMVEGPDKDQVESLAHEVADLARTNWGVN
jgi:phosphoglucosamine mutase